MLQHIGFCRRLYRWNMWYTYSEPQIFRHQIFHWKLFDLSKLYTYHLPNNLYFFYLHLHLSIFNFNSILFQWKHLTCWQFIFQWNVRILWHRFHHRIVYYCYWTRSTFVLLSLVHMRVAITVYVWIFRLSPWLMMLIMEQSCLNYQKFLALYVCLWIPNKK